MMSESTTESATRKAKVKRRMFQVRLLPELYEWLAEQAAEQDVSLRWMLERLVREAMEAQRDGVVETRPEMAP